MAITVLIIFQRKAIFVFRARYQNIPLDFDDLVFGVASSTVSLFRYRQNASMLLVMEPRGGGW